jgi:hypothetical protein
VSLEIIVADLASIDPARISIGPHSAIHITSVARTHSNMMHIREHFLNSGSGGEASVPSILRLRRMAD